jgi:hypothetical protein
MLTPPLFYRAGEHFTHCNRVTLNTGRHDLWSREDTDAQALALARTIVEGIPDPPQGGHRLVPLRIDPQACEDLWVAIAPQRSAGSASFELRHGTDAERALVLCNLIWSTSGLRSTWPVLLATASALRLRIANLERPKTFPWLGVQLRPWMLVVDAHDPLQLTWGADQGWLAEMVRGLTWALLEGVETLPE